MSKAKLLLSGLPAIGKTTLLQSLEAEKSLIIARDGKQYPFPQPHVNVPDFTSAAEFTNLIVEKVEAFEKKMGVIPETLVIDSISKVLLDIEAYCLQQIKSFPYGKVNTEIKHVVDFIEQEMCIHFNVVLVSHAIYHEENSGYALVNAGGSYGKKGGMLSEVDEAIFLELKGKNRIVHFRNPRMVARTTLSELPDSIPAEEFNLQKHIDVLTSKKTEAREWLI